MVGISDEGPRKTTICVRDVVLDLESSSRTHQWRRTLELATRIGSRPLKILVDSGSIGNYINAQEFTDRGLSIQDEKTAEELRMADGSIVQTEG